MKIFYWLILALWVIFLAYWVVSALGGGKRSLGTRTWWRGAGVRFIIIALVLLAFRIPIVNHAVRHAHAYLVNGDPRLGVAGVTLCVLGIGLGIGLAIWARHYLGQNWGLPMSRKEHPELVTTGPYAFVRHPIYTGLMLAMLGSGIAETIFWFVPFAVVGAFFVHSARAEEKLMAQEFPELYPAYQKRTKMLVPFVL